MPFEERCEAIITKCSPESYSLTHCSPCGACQKNKTALLPCGVFPQKLNLSSWNEAREMDNSLQPSFESFLSGHKQVQCVSVNIGLWSHSGQWYIVCHYLHSSVCVSVRVYVVVWHIN